MTAGWCLTAVFFRRLPTACMRRATCCLPGRSQLCCASACPACCLNPPQPLRCLPLPSIPPSRQATKGKESIAFYTLPEYEEWKDHTNLRGWTIKYYKVRSWAGQELGGRMSCAAGLGWLDSGLAAWPADHKTSLPAVSMPPAA